MGLGGGSSSACSEVLRGLTEGRGFGPSFWSVDIITEYFIVQ